MNITIARFKPIERELRRIADALERDLALRYGLRESGQPPSGEEDVSYTDEEADAVRSMLERKGKTQQGEPEE